jgi:DNA-binding transcriptional LysR family regulator
MTQSLSMHGLQPLLAFAETAKRGNFAAASREVGCTPSTLAKAVSRLEVQLGVRLFHRTTRQVTLTEDGERLFARCQRVLAELEALQEEATGAREEPTGTLRIDMPVTFGRMVMLPLLAQMVQRHPRLSVDARFSDVYVDLVKEGIDAAIRAGTLRDSSLVARPFARQELLLFAAPSYLARAGAPRALGDLSRHTGVLFRVPSTGKDRPWHLRSGGRTVAMLPPSRVRVDGGDAIVQAVTLGMGIGQVPHYMVTDGIARGELVELLPAMRPPAMPLAVVMPSGRMIPSRVRALLDLIERNAAAMPAAPAVGALVKGRASARGARLPGSSRR